MNGPAARPTYRFLREKGVLGEVSWNFKGAVAFIYTLKVISNLTFSPAQLSFGVARKVLGGQRWKWWVSACASVSICVIIFFFLLPFSACAVLPVQNEKSLEADILALAAKWSGMSCVSYALLKFHDLASLFFQFDFIVYWISLNRNEKKWATMQTVMHRGYMIFRWWIIFSTTAGMLSSLWIISIYLIKIIIENSNTFSLININIIDFLLFIHESFDNIVMLACFIYTYRNWQRKQRQLIIMMKSLSYQVLVVLLFNYFSLKFGYDETIVVPFRYPLFKQVSLISLKLINEYYDPHLY